MMKRKGFILLLLLASCGAPPSPPPPPPQPGGLSGQVIVPGDTPGLSLPHAQGGIPGWSGPLPPDAEEIVPGEVIVKFREGLAPQAAQPLLVGGVSLKAVRPLGVRGAYLYRSEGALDPQATLELVDKAASLPGVEYAVPNGIRRAHRTPNDPYYPLQWHYPLMALPSAWDLTTGSDQVRVAVLDTGIVPHPDLEGRVLGGYDFVSDPIRSGDGNGRDPDPYDAPENYHGTHVAGTIAARTDNALGVAGVDWNARVVPIRVLGEGGGATWTSWTASFGRWASPRPAHPRTPSLPRWST